MTKRAAIYARVSGDDRGKDGRNLTGQLDMCREYARAQGWHVITELAEDDRGASGASFDLPEMSQALDMAYRGEFDVLVLREMDRFARGLAKQLIVEGEFKRAGVTVDYVLENFDDTPEGQLNKNIRAVVAEYERGKIEQRMSRGRMLKVKAGSVMLHGKVPYGYIQLQDEKGIFYLIIDEQQAQVVRLIFDWYTGSKRLAIRAICRKLKGYPTPTGKKRDREWPRATVHRILTTETYAGTWHYNNGYTVEVPAIVDRATWEKAQARLKTNQQFSRRNKKHDYLISGRVTCGECGRHMAGTKKGNLVYYYCVATRLNEYALMCDNRRYYRADHVDAMTWEWVKSLFLSPEKIEKGYQDYLSQAEQHNAPLRRELGVIDDMLRENRQQLEKALDLYLGGEFAKDMLLERTRRLEETINAIQARRDDVESQLTAERVTRQQIDSIHGFVHDIGEGLEDLELEDSFETKREIVELLGVQVTLGFEERRIVSLNCILNGGSDAMPVVSHSLRTMGHNQQFVISSRIALREALANELFTYVLRAV